VRVHLDTDLGGDTDDLCALALLLGSPDVEVVGITTVADAEGRRRGMVEHALKLAGQTGIPVASGAAGFLGGFAHFPGVQDARYWPGLADLRPGPPREAIELLETNARSGATVIAIGPFTNLAVLETLCPGVFSNCQVFVMGGYLGKPEPGWPQWPASYDYNIQADRLAARIVFDRLRPAFTSLNITQRTALRRRDLPALRAGGPLARLLAVQAELHAADHDTPKLAAENPMLPHDILNFQYDSLACAAALGWDCVTIGEEQLELVQRDGELQFERGAGPVRRHVSSFDPDAFARRWLQAALNADA
jgi:purine nucleosidase